MCDTYHCDYPQRNTFRFNLIDYQLNTDLINNSFTLIENNFRF